MSSSILFIGVVAILIVFQAVTGIQFYLVHEHINELENKIVGLETIVTPKELSDGDIRFMEKEWFNLDYYQECLEDVNYDKELCSRVERLLKTKLSQDLSGEIDYG